MRSLKKYKQYRLVNFFLILTFLTATLNAEVVRIGLYEPSRGTVKIKDFVLGITVLLKEQAEMAGLDLIITNYKDPILLAKDFRERNVDLIIANSYFFAENIPFDLLDDGILPFIKTKEDYQSILTIGLRGDNRSFSEKLAGKLLLDQDEGIKLYVKNLYLEKNLASEPNFISVDTSSQSLLRLFFHKGDLAFVNKGTYNIVCELNPQINERLMVLKAIPLSIGVAAYTRKGISPNIQKKILNTMTIMNNSIRGQQFLALFHTSYFGISHPHDIDSMYLLYSRYQSRLKTSKVNNKKDK